MANLGSLAQGRLSGVIGTTRFLTLGCLYWVSLPGLLGGLLVWLPRLGLAGIGHRAGYALLGISVVNAQAYQGFWLRTQPLLPIRCLLSFREGFADSS